MTTLREAAQRAMKSLEDAIKMWTEEMEFRSCIDAADKWLESYAALREALAEPAAEPLCTAAMFDDAFLAKSGLSPDTKLYTQPPQRQPLTDAEIARVMQPFESVEPEHPFWVDVARAIERAHGIGGEE